MKQAYSIEAPDQQRLKIARLEVEAVLQKYDLAGVMVLHTPGMGEFFYRINPTYSVVLLDERESRVRIASKLDRDHGGDKTEQRRMQAQTANMTASLAGELSHAALMFVEVDKVVATMLRAESTAGVFVPDPRQARPS